MGEHYYHTRKLTGFQFDVKRDVASGKGIMKDNNKNRKDADLVFEENTVYEIDRECYDRVKKQKKR